MNKRRKGNKKGIMALVLGFCMLFGTVLTAQAEDTEFNVVIEDEFYYESEWDFDKWLDDEITPVKKSERVLTGKSGETVKITPLDGYKFVHGDSDDDTKGYKFGDAMLNDGHYNATYDMSCILVYVIEGDGESDHKPSGSHTSSYERGLKYSAQAKIVKTYSTLTNPGIDGNGHPLIYSTFVKEMPNQIASAPENGTVTFGNPTYDTLPGTVMEALKERPDVSLVFEFNYDGSARKITIPAGKADTNGYDYYGPALLLDLYGE